MLHLTYTSLPQNLCPNMNKDDVEPCTINHQCEKVSEQNSLLAGEVTMGDSERPREKHTKHKKHRSSERDESHYSKDHYSDSRDRHTESRRDNESYNKHGVNREERKLLPDRGIPGSADETEGYDVKYDITGNVIKVPRDRSRQEIDKDIETDADFPWDTYRYVLDKLFFTEKSMIQRGGKEYDDFWAFLKKYMAFQKKASSLNKGDKGKKSKKELLPADQYEDKRFKVYSRMHADELEARLKQYSGRYRQDRDHELDGDKLLQFRQLILYYIDFVQKQKVARLEKIKRDQENLPIYQRRDEIIDAVTKHQCVIVAGDTGCGKSTQVPQYLLRSSFTHIACTQPRRIACISLAKRVSYETNNEYGSEVAFHVRFEKSKTKATRILFLTEGLLLRQITSDPLLSQYEVIVMDEVHERHIHTDFLLGVVKCVLHQRPDLKLLLMSATININLFTNYFSGAPVIQVPGRLYPIQLQYLPLAIDEQSSRSEKIDPAPYIRVLQLIDSKYPRTERGDVLMFLSGMTEIMTVVEAAKAYAQRSQSWIILPLHSTLSIAEQDKVFDFPPEGVRKCIVSTNIAETSVTIDGVRFVVDSGKVKEMSFDTKFKMQKLQEFWISRASAEQRKGRAGRTGPGVCYRLYSDQDYNALQEYSTPEIHRVPLDSLILQMISMGLPDARKFPFIENPASTSIEGSLSFLKEQGAVCGEEKLTALGEMLAQLPVEVVVGKMLIMASIFHLEEPVLSLAAALSVQSPVTAKAQRDLDAMSKRKSLESDHGDPITLLNAFDEWVQVKASGEDSGRWCRRRGLEQQRFYEMTKLKQQFQQLLHEHGMLSEGSSSTRSEPLTAYERRQKHAEKRQLRELKYEQQQYSKRRKVLKMEDQDWEIAEGSGDEGESEVDKLHNNIRDLEFKLTHDLSKLHEKSLSSRSMTLKDMTLLKIILVSGLYPQVAIADEHNSYKAENEQAFHTKNKGFVLLHPTSVFTNDPSVLELQDHDVKQSSNATLSRHAARLQLSHKHQLLAYVSILETTKPYLVGTLRVPALQTLLLFSQDIDTNTDCTRVLCDGWLELRFEEADDAEWVLTSVVQLRAAWAELIQLKLHTSGEHTGVDSVTTYQRQARRVERVLSAKLAEFLHAKVYYCIRRVLPAELQYAYIGPDAGVDVSEGVGDVLQGLMGAGGDPHPVKGGTRVTPYLTYNCLAEEEGAYSSCVQRHWMCPQCGENLVVTLGERLHHQQYCPALHQSPDKLEEQARKDGMDKLRKDYRCGFCGEDFRFTSAEMLKHRKDCARRV